MFVEVRGIRVRKLARGLARGVAMQHCNKQKLLMCAVTTHLPACKPLNNLESVKVPFLRSSHIYELPRVATRVGNKLCILN